jgi:hypothetical protein
MDNSTSIRPIKSIFAVAIALLTISLICEFIPGIQGDTIARQVVPKFPFKTEPVKLDGDKGALYDQRLLVLNDPTFLQRLLGASNSIPGLLTSLSPLGMLYFLLLSAWIWSRSKNITPAKNISGMTSILKLLLNGIIGYQFIQIMALFYMSNVVLGLTAGHYHIETTNINGYLIMELGALTTLLIINTQTAAAIQKEQELTI